MAPLKSKCLNKDDYKNGIQVKAGDNFEIGWTFQNNGKKSWPQGTELVKVAGDDIQMTERKQCDKIVDPDRKWIMYVNFKAPDVSGKYHAFFRLSYNESN